MISERTIELLHFYHDKYNAVSFIENDPISIPHRFSKNKILKSPACLQPH